MEQKQDVYYHSKPVDLKAIANALMKMPKEKIKELLHDKQKLKQVLFGKEIDKLDPHVSSHGEALVYAAKDRVTSLLFGSSKSHGDLDGKIEYKDGKPVFKEAYPGALKERFDRASCVLFEVDGQTFDPELREFSNGTKLFDGEIVSRESVQVKKSTKVKNIYAEIMAAAERGEIEIQEYQRDNPEYVAEMEEHIKNTILRANGGKILDNPDSATFKFCMKKNPHIMKQLLQEREHSIEDAGMEME